MSSQEISVIEGPELPVSPEQAKFLPVLTMGLALQRRETVVQVTKQLMEADIDYGVIPGTTRPTLLQPGADKLCNLFGLVVQYEIVEVVKDWTGIDHGGEPFFYYEVKGRAFRGDVLLGEGIGSCNSWEAKYRWRKSERMCPGCGKANIRKSKVKPDGKPGGWYCWAKTGGCGATFPEGDKAIESQEVGRIPNPDVFDLVNTVEKIAFKRCKVSTTINATSASEFFTQDLEDSAEIDTGGHPAGTREAAHAVAERKIAALKDEAPLPGRFQATDDDLPPELSGHAPAPVPDRAPEPERATATAGNVGGGGNRKLWKSFKEMLDYFHEMKAALTTAGDGEVGYYGEMDLAGVKHANEFKSKEAAVKCYRAMESRLAMIQGGGTEATHADA